LRCPRPPRRPARRSRTYIEEEAQVEGDLEVLYEDRDVGSRTLYFLQTASGRLSLHFAANPPALLTGTRVRAKGVQVGAALALPNTLGGQKTLVILVNFQDKATQSYTVAYAQGVFNTTSNFYLENSFQQTWLTGVMDSGQAADVRGWYTIALSSTVCDTFTLASQARSAAQANGVNLSLYTRYVYAFPDNACTWWGLGRWAATPPRPGSTGASSSGWWVTRWGTTSACTTPTPW
jgi:hypothetical protein